MLRNNADARRCSYFELGLPVRSLSNWLAFTISEVSNRLNLRFGITFKRQIEMIRESRGCVAERCGDNKLYANCKKVRLF